MLCGNNMGAFDRWLYENMQPSVCFCTVNIPHNQWPEHELFEINNRLSDIEQSIENRGS